MTARKPGRYLAPLAIVAVIVATALVVRAGLGSTHHATTTTATTGVVSTHHAVRHKRFYVIRVGDSLSSISVKTGLSVGQLEALNPSVDPNALQTGDRLRLR
jgi:LysM repeat protein